MGNNVTAKVGRVAHKISQGASSISTCLLLAVKERLNEQWNGGFQVLVQRSAMKRCVANRKTCKLSRRLVTIPAAIDQSRYD